MTSQGKALDLDRIFPKGSAREAFEEGYAAGLGASVVKRLRRHAGVDEASELAHRLGVTPTRISAVESGRGRDGPSLGLLLRVAEACGLSLRLEAVRRSDGVSLSIPLIGEMERESPPVVGLLEQLEEQYSELVAAAHEIAGRIRALSEGVSGSHGPGARRAAGDLGHAFLLETAHHSMATDVGERRPKSKEMPTPAVPVRRSITPDYLICLEDGRKLKTLKRHLRAAYDMTPEEYRAKWGLPADYPMVAPNYAKHKSELARKTWFGRASTSVEKSGGRRKKA